MSVGWDMEKNFWPKTKYVAAQGASFLKSPIKMLQEMQKKNYFFQKLLGFRAFFEKVMFLENGHGRHQMVAMLIH